MVISLIWQLLEESLQKYEWWRYKIVGTSRASNQGESHNQYSFVMILVNSYERIKFCQWIIQKLNP